MALTISKGLDPEIMRLLLGFPSKSVQRASFGQNFSTTRTLSFGDSFLSSSSDAVLMFAVQKLQAAVNRPVQLANGQTLGGATVGQASFRIQSSSQSIALSTSLNGLVAAGPTREQIEQGVADAGGRAALSPWLVDGKTKIGVNGRGMVAQVDGDSGSASAPAADPRAAAEASLARFGLAASRLDGDLGALRDDLRRAADSAGRDDPNLSLAIEYALEDAFKKVRALEDSRKGVSPTSYEDQLAINRKQADSIVSQLELGLSSTWAMDSAAVDLAVFGKDLTALADRSGLAAELTKTRDAMLADLKKRYTGTEYEYYSETRRIDGAYSRLMGGLTSSGATASATMSVSGSVKVTVAGVELDASSVVSMVNVISDPLVFDLAGDGIDLRSAENGVDFDMDGDGVASRTGFIQGDDAFLFYNESGADTVTDGRQLFGNADGYANGFEKLRAYDDNGDGVIDENDAIYDKLRLWQDRNGDGQCDASETMSLAEAGIKSIRLGYDDVREDDGKGNLIGQKGSFTRADGSEGLAADVWLRELAARQ